LSSPAANTTGHKPLRNHQTLMGDETFKKPHAVGGQVQRLVRQ